MTASISRAGATQLWAILGYKAPLRFKREMVEIEPKRSSLFRASPKRCVRLMENENESTGYRFQKADGCKVEGRKRHQRDINPAPLDDGVIGGVQLLPYRDE